MLGVNYASFFRGFDGRSMEPCYSKEDHDLGIACAKAVEEAGLFVSDAEADAQMKQHINNLKQTAHRVRTAVDLLPIVTDKDGKISNPRARRLCALLTEEGKNVMVAPGISGRSRTFVAKQRV